VERAFEVVAVVQRRRRLLYKPTIVLRTASSGSTSRADTTA
jgi:hypothetical protein